MVGFLHFIFDRILRDRYRFRICGGGSPLPPDMQARYWLADTINLIRELIYLMGIALLGLNSVFS